MMLKPFFSKLHNDQDGATLIEFAIIAPAFLILLMGTFDLGYSIFLRASLSGAVLDAARISTLETAPATQANIDAEVSRRIDGIASNSQVSFARQSYFDFADVARPEAITGDENENGVCDEGDSFEDENGNGAWDSDVGEDGIGGPNDVVLYTVTMQYDRLFPLYSLIGLPERGTIDVTTVLRNQPYGLQNERAAIQELTC